MNSIVKGNTLQVAVNVRQYMEGGAVNFEKVLAISSYGRIPNLTHVYGLQAIHKIVTALLTSFSNSLNLVRPMSPEQIMEASHELVMTSEEDFLSIEDYVLFFKGAKEGKYGKILDRLDQQVIFQLLEEYRLERHRQYQRIKETKHLELKSLGPSERSVQLNELEQGMYNMVSRIDELKHKLKEQREINRAGRLSNSIEQ